MAEYKQYITQIQENGNVMISEDVVAAIVANALADTQRIISSVKACFVLIFDNFNLRFCILGYLGRLNATDISRICSSLIPSGSKPIFLEAM